MFRSLSRRAAALGLAASALAPAAYAQAVNPFDRLQNSGATVEDIFTVIRDWADNRGTLSLSALEKAGMRREVRSLKDALMSLLASNTSYFRTVDVYLRTARRPEASATDLRNTWDLVCASLQYVLRQVQQAGRVIDSSQHLDVAVSQSQRNTIESGLQARAGIVAELAQLPPPTSEAELVQLDRVNTRYRQIHQRLREAVDALVRLEQRLT